MSENAKKAAEELNERDKFLISKIENLPIAVDVNLKSFSETSKDEAIQHAKQLREQLIKAETI